jgi:heat shock protein HslJ
MTRHRLAAAALGLATLAALPARADLTGDIPAALQQDWVLAEVDNQTVTYTATFRLGADGRLAGQAPCNRYFGGVDGPLPDFRATGIGATRMACDRLSDEQAYFTLLQDIDRLTWSEAELHLSGGGHQLVFRPAAR